MGLAAHRVWRRGVGTALAAVVAAALAAAAGPAAMAWTPLPVKGDRSVFMPGTQQGGANLESQGRCDNCHGGYDPAVEPAFNQYGSMMAQAARDPLWLACLTVAAQDSIWAVGNPNATDICIRCHSPVGWLGGRSDPTNTSRLTGTDFEGVSCDTCHRMLDPLTQLGQPEVPPETVPAAQTAAATTHDRDLAVLSTLRLFDGTTPFLDPVTKLPTWYGDGLWPNYVESTAGQYFVDTGNGKSGPYYDDVARHTSYYSRFHRSRRFCGTCHDVSNPVLASLASPGLPERQAAGSYLHVERTFSEFMLSAYGRGGASSGIPGVPFAASCQDCHMRAVSGKGCNKADAPLRSDLPLHDQTGGNAWLLGILASVSPTSPTYDPYNAAILNGTKYPGAKVDTAGLQWVPNELLAGRQRSLQQLRQAASLEVADESAAVLTLRVRNHTGHKLISGFPEGRRMFLYVTFYDADGRMLAEVNPYEPLRTTRDAQGNEVEGIQRHDEHLVWEAEMSSALTGEQKSFHFALATDRYKDNRIPPRGFDTAAMAARLAQPRWEGEDAPGYFTAEEYAGGYDEVTLAKPEGTATWYATLYYQTTSRDYVEFLRDEIEGTATSLSTPAPSGETAAYIAQTDPFFANLRDWGDALWDLWLHNGGAAPTKMTEAGTAPHQGVMVAVGNLRGTWLRKRLTGFLLRWDRVAGATAYEVERLSGSTWVAVATTTAESLRVGRDGGVTYRVRATKVLPDTTVTTGPWRTVTTGG